MKKILIPILALVIVCFGLKSCYKDLGNYDYLDYNKIERVDLDQAKSSSHIVLGDTIIITPIIKWKYPDRDTTETAFEYKWVFDDSVVSKERVLKFVPDKVIQMEACFLYITEKKTGIVSESGFMISVSSAFSSGWTILSEKGGKSVLSFIRRYLDHLDEYWMPVYKYTEYKDIYGTLFSGEQLGSSPQKLFYIMTDYFGDEIMVLQNPDETVYLSGDDFSKQGLLKDEFPGKKYPDGFIPKDFVDAGQCTYVSGNNGEVYWKINPPPFGNLHLASFISLPLYYPRGSQIAFFPKISAYDSEMVHMYDVMHNRLLLRFSRFGEMAMSEILGANINIINFPKPDEVEDITNLGNFEMVCLSGSVPGYQFAPLDYTMILKDKNSGDYFLQTYTTQGAPFSLNIQIVNQQQELFAGSALLSDQSVFLLMRNRPFLFFAEGSKLYIYDKITRNVKLYHDFRSGRIVKMAADAPETEIGIAMDNGNMYICSTDLWVLGAPDPGAAGGILHHAGGLEKIVDLIWKYGGIWPYRLNSY